MESRNQRVYNYREQELLPYIVVLHWPCRIEKGGDVNGDDPVNRTPLRPPNTVN